MFCQDYTTPAGGMIRIIVNPQALQFIKSEEGFDCLVEDFKGKIQPKPTKPKDDFEQFMKSIGMEE